MIATHKRILAVYEEVGQDHPKKSTEWRMAMTIDIYRERHNDEIDTSDIVDALEARLSQ